MSSYFGNMLLLTCGVFCAGVGFYLGHKNVKNKQNNRKYGDQKICKKCLQIITKFIFLSEKDRDQFIQWWKNLAAFTAENEPGVLAYEISISDKDSLQAVVFARYIDREYMENVHRQSSVYLKFEENLKESGIQIQSEGAAYVELDVGYMSA